jgi:starch-binding outer membrane protein, SusD/RagB family
MNQKIQNIHKGLLALSVLLIAFAFAGCKKFLEVKPPSTSINEQNVYKSDATAIAVLTGIYARYGMDGISVLSGLSADELTLASVVSDQRLIAYYHNQLRTSVNVNSNYGVDFWSTPLNRIFICNAAIDGLNNTSSLTEAVKNQLLGEAKFMRAFYYFYLVNYYGDVPLVLTTNPNVTRVLARSPKQQVYDQIIMDLKDAQSLLSSVFLDATLLRSSSERVRPTKWAATALLARTYLYLSQYADAEGEASTIIANTTDFSLPAINSVFSKNSDEAIWQLQPVEANRNTEDAMIFKLPSTGPNADPNNVYLSPQILNAFEAGDARRMPGGWVDSVIAGGITYYFPAKYRATITNGAATEYLMIFRLAEQYLIRAEARAKQNNLQSAMDDINVIRTRAALPGITASDQASLLMAVLKERQIELFTEWGHRWLDLKRTGKVDEVMSIVTPLKSNGGNWQSYQQLYPILFPDIQKNANLTQNPGY